MIHTHGVSKIDCKVVSKSSSSSSWTSTVYWFGKLSWMCDRLGRKCLGGGHNLLRCLSHLTDIWLLTEHLLSVWHQLLTGYRLAKVKINTTECIFTPCLILRGIEGKPGYLWLHVHLCVTHVLISCVSMSVCVWHSEWPSSKKASDKS